MRGVGREAVIEGCVAHDWEAAGGGGRGEDEIVHGAFEARGVDEGVAPGAAVDEAVGLLEMVLRIGRDGG